MTAPIDIGIGSIVVARRETGVCDVGEIGVCYETYTLAGRPGFGIIFASGRYDGFSPADAAVILEITGRTCADLAGYRFRDVMQLRRDYHAGRFNAAFVPPDGPDRSPARAARALVDAARRRQRVHGGSLDESIHGVIDDCREVYRILDPNGCRSGPDGSVLLEARDLGELRDCAETVSRSNPPGVYPIVVTGESDPDGVWGELRVDGPDSWEIHAQGDTVIILPGAFIL